MEQTNRNNRKQSFLMGLFIFFAGILFGLLTAPRSGRGSRSWIGQKSSHLKNNLFGLREKAGRRTRYEEGRLRGLTSKIGISETKKRHEREEFVDDDLTTQRVRTKIGENSHTWHIPRLNVDTANGVVTLRGRTDNDEKRQQLEEIVRSVPDVNDVVNKIVILKKAADA